MVDVVRLAAYYDGLELHLDGRLLTARFLMPHRTVSTCPVSGGLREDLTGVYNRQLCEPVAHDSQTVRDAARDPSRVHQDLCAKRGLVADTTASMLTAANMRCVGLSARRFRDLVVAAACTAGIEGNAVRAADPAGYIEWNGSFEPLDHPTAAHALEPDVPDTHGTINTMLFISHELTPGAMVQSVITATEAKTAALADLVVGSRYGPGKATGTGTDQIASACRLGTGQVLTSAGTHSLLGQTIAQVVCEAINQSLALQNGLLPDRQRSLVAQLGRFGVSWELCLRRARQLLSAEDANLLGDNINAIDRDPLVAAAAAALAEVTDQYRAGIFPVSCGPELAVTYGANLACAVAGTPDAAALVRPSLEGLPLDLPLLAPTAVVLGFAQKWRE
jgi:adenosylcobinamide amidohydrolase